MANSRVATNATVDPYVRQRGPHEVCFNFTLTGDYGEVDDPENNEQDEGSCAPTSSRRHILFRPEAKR